MLVCHSASTCALYLTGTSMVMPQVDKVSGQLTDPRSRFLGTRPPRLFAVPVRGARSLLALSSRPWLGHSDQGRFSVSPLSYEPLDYAASACVCACLCACRDTLADAGASAEAHELSNWQLLRESWLPCNSLGGRSGNVCQSLQDDATLCSDWVLVWRTPHALTHFSLNFSCAVILVHSSPLQASRQTSAPRGLWRSRRAASAS
jgi:hypothetical protein